MSAADSDDCDDRGSEADASLVTADEDADEDTDSDDLSDIVCALSGVPVNSSVPVVDPELPAPMAESADVPESAELLAPAPAVSESSDPSSAAVPPDQTQELFSASEDPASDVPGPEDKKEECSDEPKPKRARQGSGRQPAPLPEPLAALSRILTQPSPVPSGSRGSRDGGLSPPVSSSPIPPTDLGSPVRHITDPGSDPPSADSAKRGNDGDDGMELT